MLLSPEQYGEASVGELLRAAARGQIGLDQRWLRAILERGPACAPELLAFIRRTGEDEVFDLEEDVLAIARELACPEVVPVLIELARRHSEDFPELLVEAFQAVGAPAVEPLLALRQELQDTRELDSLLAGLGVHDPRILEILLEQLRRDPAEAALLLGIYRDPASRPALEEALTRAADEEIRRALREAIEMVEGREPFVRSEPIGIWSLYPETASPEFAFLPEQELLGLLASPLPEWRLGAARELSLREISDHARQCLVRLALEDPDPAVRGASWRALAVSAGDEGHREAMLARLSDPSISPPEARGLLVALAAQAQDPAVRRWILDFYDRPETRAAALEAMWISGDRRFVPYLRQHLDDQDPEVRRQAVAGVGWLDARSEIHRLLPLFNDPEVRKEALQAYALLAPAEESAWGIRRLLKRIEEMAGGLSQPEADLIKQALGFRFPWAGAWLDAAPADDEAQTPASRARQKVGRNEPCPCGSGKKYKKCCGA